MTHPACVQRIVRRCKELRTSTPRCLLAGSTALIAFLAAASAAGAFPADFTWSPDPAIEEEPTIFTAVQNESVTLYRWDLNGNGSFDDSEDADGPQATRTFHKAKTYTIGLLTVDVEGNMSEKTKSVRVVESGTTAPNQPPEASFVFFPAGPVAGEAITFVSTSTDPDSPISPSALRWDLNGDGVFDDAVGASATTTFPEPGTYSVSLQVTTNKVAVATAVLNVGVPGVPGTSVGQRGLSLMSPFPVVRIAGRVSKRGARIRRLTVDAPPGATVSIACAGRGCPFRRASKMVSTVPRAGSVLPPTRLLRFRRLEGRLLRPGAVLQLYVTRAGSVGKYTRFKVRRKKAPARRDMCLVPGSGRPLSCPAD